jgi:glyoxylase-like metal-dependent hydrolase (beta-lactamase superfamily II)
MSRPTFVLSREVSLAVLTRGRSEADHHEDLGCSILGPTSRAVRLAHAPLKRVVQGLGRRPSAKEAVALVRWLEDTPAYRALCDGERRHGGRRRLREAVRFPEVKQTPPRVLHVRRGARAFDLPVGVKGWPQVLPVLEALGRGATKAELGAFSDPLARELVETLMAAGWLERQRPALALPTPGLTFIGHHTILVRGHEGAVLIDPVFRPASEVDLPGYQPMQLHDVGPIDAVLITHSHGDHFHLGTLAQLPRTTRIFVPPVDRESLFSTDCVARLKQLGFEHVEPLPWWHSRLVGDLEVRALPFYGEQPTGDALVWEDLWNVGSTWLVRGPHGASVFYADAGDDARGSMRAVSRRLSKEGPVSELFCGVRGFKVRPLFFGFSTLDAYLVNVPLDALMTPQVLMADAREALELARLLGAQTLLPCADGGAPWYWREGMGPRYPGFPGEPVQGASRFDEHPDTDPYPERVQEVRASLARGPKVKVLRPGEALVGARVRRFDGFRWPF